MFIEKLQTLFERHHITKIKALAIFAILLIIIIAVPLTIIELQKQQSLRQRASENPITFQLTGGPVSESSVTKDSLLSFNVTLSQGTPPRDIAAIDIEITYTPETLEVVSFNPNESILSSIKKTTAIAGKIQYTGVNSNTEVELNQQAISLGTVEFRAKETGSAQIQFTKTQASARGIDKFLSVDTASANPYVYTISAAPVSNRHQRVFVSSQTYNGNLGGLTGGDAKCQELADDAELGGTWMAWLSDSTNSPSTRFVKSDIPYKLVDETLIANNWDDLTSGTLKEVINKTESGDRINKYVRTGTDASGNLTGSNCTDWTSTAPTGIYSTVGHTSSRSSWSNLRNQGACDSQFHLYCFEQITLEQQTPTPTPTSQQPVPSLTPAPTVSAPTGIPTPTGELTPTLSPTSSTLTLPSFALEGFRRGQSNNLPLTVFLYPDTVDPSTDSRGQHANARRTTGVLTANPGNANTDNTFSLSRLNLGEIPSGTYKILIKIKAHLRKLIATITIPESGTPIVVPAEDLDNFAIGDVDDNNQLDIADYNSIRDCFGSKAKGDTCKFKENADLNQDGAVDGLDYNLFLKSLSFTSRQGN